MDIVHFEMIEVLANIKRVVKRNIRELFNRSKNSKISFRKKKGKVRFSDFPSGSRNYIIK